MGQNEEGKLEKWREDYQDLPIPDQDLSDSVRKATHQVELRQRRQRKSLLSVAVVAIVCMIFVTTINVSPTFAQQIGKIPGMSHLVELVKFNKGHQLAIEHDYFEEINETVSQGDVSFTIDGVIRDQYGMAIFYTVELEEDDLFRTPTLNEAKIFKSDQSELQYTSYSFGGLNESSNGSYSGTAEIFTDEPIEETEFVFETEIRDEKFEVPFVAENQAEPVTYHLQESISINDDEMIIEEIAITPLRTEIIIDYATDNDWEYLNIEDLRLVNEHGETWASITNGISGSGTTDGKDIHYLQSHYFDEPESLTLEFSKFQAVPKGLDYLELDLENDEILHDPLDKFSDFTFRNGGIEIYLDTEDFHYYPLGRAYDSEGEEIDDHYSSSMSPENGRSRLYYSLNAESSDLPITVELNAYPHWIDDFNQVTIE
ncbi:DUF4179 domain-containing protein [Alkalibacillus aidingensis]|uniref:DUF4179 domain-containing protein n=1 Tax=Alkalibacillus aidingensis TaxID=2747607 RepID=UPI0016616CEB|nr:DUF4179 domain-containing protein [Alkalibacillus aidingensis]